MKSTLLDVAIEEEEEAGKVVTIVNGRNVIGGRVPMPPALSRALDEFMHQLKKGKAK